MRNVLILVDQRFYKYSWNLFLFRCARILLKKLISIYYYKIPRNLTKEILVFLMLVSAGETHRCNSHGNTGSTVDRVSNDKKHGGRWWQASFHVRFTRGFMTLAPSHAVVRCKPTFQPAVHLSTVLRESFFHPFRLPGPRYSSRLFSWQTTFPPRPIFLENSDAKHCFDSYR